MLSALAGSASRPPCRGWSGGVGVLVCAGVAWKDDEIRTKSVLLLSSRAERCTSLIALIQRGWKACV